VRRALVATGVVLLVLALALATIVLSAGEVDTVGV
jgi:hypothetical protein